MRNIAGLLLALCVLRSNAQGPPYAITFDPGSPLQLDSVYPAGAWQVGAPDKPAFDSAWSAPGALVTDTMAPYPVGGPFYAEFHLPNSNGEWGPAFIQLSFTHRLDFDTGEAAGWVEVRNPYDTNWVRLMDPDAFMFYDVWTEDPSGTVTDSGFVYNGPTDDWNTALIGFSCMAVVNEPPEDRGGGEESLLHFRFVFGSSANTNGLGGWLIDDVRMDHWGACNAIDERAADRLTLAPNPASGHVTITFGATNEQYAVDLLAMDGRVVRSERALMRSHSIDVGELDNGAYLVRARDAHGTCARTIIVAH